MHTYSGAEFEFLLLVNMLKLLRILNEVIFRASSDYFWIFHSIEKIWQNNKISESEFKQIIKSKKKKIEQNSSWHI